MNLRLIFLPLALAPLAGLADGLIRDDRPAPFTPPKADAAGGFSKAPDWLNDAFPIGNGRLGAMLAGGTDVERIQFNEESLWVGDEEDTGSYQNFGEILLRLDGAEKPAKYERHLDVDKALAVVKWEKDGVLYVREAFASHPANVIVIRQTASKPGMLSGSVALNDAHGAKTVASGDTLASVGAIPSHPYDGGKKTWPELAYESRVKVVTSGGSKEVRGGKIFFKGADTVTLFLDAGTDFRQGRRYGWRGPKPASAIGSRLSGASSKSFGALFEAHLADYKALYERAKIDLGGVKTPDTRTAAARLEAYKENAPDLALEELLFDYGRYLLISSSRAGGVPSNLQGRWNDSNNPPWRSDYHTDVNVEMNYWAADSANLSECFTPFADWIESIRGPRIDATKAAFKVRGWAMRGESGLFGGSTWDWVPGTAAWLMQNEYDHYRFTRDKEYLRKKAYPAMKEICEFWFDRLKKQPDGTFVTPPGMSPEHGPIEDGVSFDTQLAWDVFNSTAEAADILGVDKAFRDEARDKQKKLPAPKIGKWGQLQEWAVDRDSKGDKHRHISHLMAVFPCRQITPRGTPELAAAAKVSLDARGDAGTGWSTAQKINTWARLADGDRSHRLFAQLLRLCTINHIVMTDKGGLYRNLLCAHPPFQIDGNLGYVSGVVEMLIQSHTEEIELLPALPKAWPAGSFRGLRARGDYTVDCSWKDGRVVSYKIVAGKNADRSAKVKLRVNGELKEVAAE